MPTLNPTVSPNSIAIASGAVLLGLLDAIVAKGVLSTSEVRDILQSAMLGIGTRAQTPDGFGAGQIITDLLDHLSERTKS
jgi:hypothetical protein